MVSRNNIFLKIYIYKVTFWMHQGIWFKVIGAIKNFHAWNVVVAKVYFLVLLFSYVFFLRALFILFLSPVLFLWRFLFIYEGGFWKELADRMGATDCGKRVVPFIYFFQSIEYHKRVYYETNLMLINVKLGWFKDGE